MQFYSYIDIFQDVFFPPEGYEIEWVELTTWSLAKDWLRIISAMIAAGNSSILKTRLRRPNSYLKGNNNSRCFHVFYDGKINTEQEDAAYYQTANGKFSLYLFDKCCTPVKLDKGLFHPKMILLQFKKKGDDNSERLFRLFVSSRNLTWSDYIETGVLLDSFNSSSNEKNINDSEEPKTIHKTEIGQILADFLKKYYEKNGKTTPEELKVCELEKAHFRIVTKDGKVVDEDPELYFGKDTCLKTEIMNSIDSFINSGEQYWEYILSITSMKPNLDLFKSKKYSCQYVCNFKDMYEPKAGSKGWWKIKEDHRNISSWYVAEKDNQKKPLSIHSKQYMFWGNYEYEFSEKKYRNYKNNKVLVYMGSANCSKHGLEGERNNEEMLIKFTCDIDSNNTTTLPLLELKSTNSTQFAVNKYFQRSDEVYADDIDEVEDETLDDKFLNIEIIKAEYKKNMEHGKSKLTVVIKSEETENLSIWPASCSGVDEARTVKYGENEPIEFELNNSNFSRVLLARKGDKLFSLRLILTTNDGEVDDKWYGKDYDALKKSLPFDPLAELSNLIADKETPFSPDDNVFEKLTKCKIKMDGDVFKKLCDDTLQRIKELEDLLNSGDQTENNEASEDVNLARIFERTEEVEAFKDLLEMLKER